MINEIVEIVRFAQANPGVLVEFFLKVMVPVAVIFGSIELVRKLRASGKIAPSFSGMFEGGITSHAARGMIAAYRSKRNGGPDGLRRGVFLGYRAGRAVLDLGGYTVRRSPSRCRFG